MVYKKQKQQTERKKPIYIHYIDMHDTNSQMYSIKYVCEYFTNSIQATFWLTSS